MQHDSTHTRRSSIASRIAGYVFLIIAVCILSLAWLVHTQLRWSLQQQADALGHSLLQHNRRSAESALSANDTLSVAVLLRELVDNPYVSHAALHNTDDRVLAEAGKRPKPKHTEHRLYSQELSLHNIKAGYIVLHIDMKPLQQPLAISMQTLGGVGALLLLLAAFLSVHLGRSIALPLQNLSNWLINPIAPAPHTQRSDEVGLLARQLNQYYGDDTHSTSVTTEHSATATVAADTTATATPAAPTAKSGRTVLPTAKTFNDAPIPDKPTPAPSFETFNLSPIAERTAVLAVELNSMEQLRQLPSETLIELLKKYRTAVKHAAELHHGQLHSLADGRSLITFHNDSAEYPRNAVCCGELLRAFGHALQHEISGSGVQLHIQLGLSEGQTIKDASLGELLLNASTQTAMTLSQHSTNQLLMSNSIAHNSRLATCARLRPVMQPEHSSCLETLLSPYPAILQDQLQSLQRGLV